MNDRSRWLRIGGSLFIGLFVAFIDRTNLSVTLPAITKELGLNPETATLLLTIFLIGYAFANFFGGILTMKYDPKYVVISMVCIWSLATIYIGFSNSIFALLACRLLLGVTEGVYWPQQSRFANDWFSDKERSRANSVIQFHGQFLALAIGFMILMPLEAAFGWRTVFIVTGLLGLIIVIPLFIFVLRPQREAPFHKPAPAAGKVKLTWGNLGGKSFLLLLFSYISQGFLFWGITLWIPMVASSLGFQGMARALASSVPYIVAIILVIPMSYLSDKTGKRIQIASLGLFLPGICMFMMDSARSCCESHPDRHRSQRAGPQLPQQRQHYGQRQSRPGANDSIIARGPCQQRLGPESLGSGDRLASEPGSNPRLLGRPHPD